MDALNRTGYDGVSVNEHGMQTAADYTPNPLNQYHTVGGQPLSYDAKFNLTGYSGAAQVYNAANQLTAASKGGESVQMVYDGLGRCVKRTTNGVAWVFSYEGWQPILEWDKAGNRFAYNIYGAGVDEILLRDAVSVGYLRYHADWKGSVQFLLDGNGAGLERYSYDAFGQPTVSDWMGGNVRHWSNQTNWFMFTGREWIMQIGVYDYRNRWYQPQLGRFLQPDPIGFDAGDMNLFRYCGGDPVNKIDPMGLEGEGFGPGELESAVAVARRQVEAAVLDPNRKSAWANIVRKGERVPTRIEYYPSKMVPVFREGKGYRVGPTIDGVVVTRGNQTRELESIRGDVAVPVHAHNDKREGTKTPGLAMPGWSDRDLKLRDVDRMDESNFGKWYSRRNGKEVPADGASRRKAPNTSTASGSSSNSETGSYVNIQVSAPSAAEVDLAHQATGVPSLGAESVNVPHGKY